MRYHYETDPTDRLSCLRESRDNGATRAPLLTVEAGEAGYSDISVTPDGRIPVLYETSKEGTEVLRIYQ